MNSRAPMEPTDETLAYELVRAGHSITIEPVPDELVGNVLAAIGSAPAPRRRRWLAWWHWLRARRRRLVAAVIAVVLLLGAFTPPVRAAVGEWLRIGGVLIRTGSPPVRPSTQPPGRSPSPAGSRELTLEQARAAVAFPIGVPSVLGAPERITVTDDHRVVGMDWTVDGRPVHLDQFDGTISWVFVKQNWSIVTPTDVAGADAVWLADPHEIVYVDRDGIERHETARLSGPSLIWQPTLDGRELTVRLEGITGLEQARTIAESLG